MNLSRFTAETHAYGTETNVTLTHSTLVIVLAWMGTMETAVTTSAPVPVPNVLAAGPTTVWTATSMLHGATAADVSANQDSLDPSANPRATSHQLSTTRMKPMLGTTHTHGAMDRMTTSTDTSTVETDRAPHLTTDTVTLIAWIVQDQPTRTVSLVSITAPWIATATAHATSTGQVMTAQSMVALAIHLATRLEDALDPQPATALAASHTHHAMPTESASATPTGLAMTVAST